MARTPLAARTRIDRSFSDGYDSDNLGALGGQNLSLANRANGEDATAFTICGVRTGPAGDYNSQQDDK